MDPAYKGHKVRLNLIIRLLKKDKTELFQSSP